MEILLSTSGGKPIYEQITDQIKAAILDGEINPGNPLPGMRTLAKDLGISVITTKRAYFELENEGFITTVVGKGCFVSELDSAAVRESGIRKIDAKLDEIVMLARTNKVSLEELGQMLSEKYGVDE